MKKTNEFVDGVVRKIIFEDEGAIAETVVYEYQDRKVICFSVQSGCPVGCVFCGTGNKFIRNLTEMEICEQIREGLKGKEYPRVQLMFMSMGDPMLNWANVKNVAQVYMSMGYYFFISTVGFKMPEVLDDIIKLGGIYHRFGLQFSLHRTTDAERSKLFRNQALPYLSIHEMSDVGTRFRRASDNQAYFNYIVTGCETSNDIQRLKVIMGMGHHLTLSVMCNIQSPKKSDAKPANDLFELLKNYGHVSLFDPAGQDTIGAGCGQLLYTQKKFKELGRI